MRNIQDQNFGVEIELTGITREAAAKVIADYYGTGTVYHRGGTYRVEAAKDTKGREWKCEWDSSIRRTRLIAGRQECTMNDKYGCEVVTPILQYEDMEDLQEIVRKLREAGAVANDSCGIHVHVDGANHTPESLQRLVNFAVGRQDLFYEALQIGDRGDRWCRKMDAHVLKGMKDSDNLELADVERIWYSAANDGYHGGIDHTHYNSTRYHGINLHAFFTKGTVEFRLFNGTTHAGKIKAYIQFCLAMSAWAINCPSTNLHFASLPNYTVEQRGKLMRTVLTRRLGMTGPEFATARKHLTAAFQTC